MWTPYLYHFIFLKFYSIPCMPILFKVQYWITKCFHQHTRHGNCLSYTCYHTFHSSSLDSMTLSRNDHGYNGQVKDTPEIVVSLWFCWHLTIANFQFSKSSFFFFYSIRRSITVLFMSCIHTQDQKKRKETNPKARM